MTNDEAIARSVNVGHEVKRRLVEKYPSTLKANPELVDEIQCQAELAYLQAVKDVYVDITASAIHGDAPEV